MSSPRLRLLPVVLIACLTAGTAVASPAATASGSSSPLPRFHAAVLEADGTGAALTLDRATVDRLLTAAGMPSPWAASAPAGQPRGQVALTFSGDGRCAFAFPRHDGGLDFASFDGANWTTTTIAPAGSAISGVSLALGPGGQPAIVCLAGRSPAVQLARRNDSGWQISTIDAAGIFFWSPSVAFAPDGSLAVAYVETGSGQTRLARSDQGIWHTRSLDWADVTGCSPSLSFDSHGQLTITFTDLADLARKRSGFDGDGSQLAQLSPADSARRTVALTRANGEAAPAAR